jgi:hypothetical protein
MSRPARIRLLALAAAVALTPALALLPQTVVPTLQTASAAATCSQAEGGTKFYPGDNSSRVYNTTFHRGVSTNHALQNYVPQGLGVWGNWNGGSEDLFLVGMHHRDEEKYAQDKDQPRGLIYGITVSTGKLRGAAYLPHGAHAGSVRTYKGWLYVQQSTSMIRRYSLKAVRASFKSAGTQSLGGGTPQAVSGVSFFDIDGGRLYGGHFNENGRDWMHRWTISSKGNLTLDRGWGARQVPKKAQGLLVLSNAYVFSTSSGRNNHSNIYVTRRNYRTNFESTTYRCFEAPVLAEDLVGFGGRTYLSFEGGADYFDGNFPWTTADNKIKNLHWASTETLRGMVW